MTSEQEAFGAEFRKWKRDQEATWLEQIEDAERGAGILRSALAESERLRVEAEEQAAHDRAELSTVIAARDRAIDDRNEWRYGYERETNRAAQAEAERDELKMKTDLATGNYERSFHISEKLRGERDEALERVAFLEEQALHRSYSATDAEREKWEAVKAYEDAAQELHETQEKVAALTRLVAQSSTQYREMVKALDECRRGITSMIARTEQLHDSPKSLLDSMTRDLPDMVSTVEHIDAVLGRSTP